MLLSGDLFAALTTHHYWIDYAPSYNSVSDSYNPNPTDNQITSDLKALYQEGWRGLVTYTLLGTHADVPRIAKSVGFQYVIAGVWDPTNPAEVAIASAPSVLPYADGFDVGNEGLISTGNPNGRYTFSQLTAAISQVQQATGKPVTTTQPGQYYVTGAQYAGQLLGLGDWLFPNIDYFFFPGASTPAQTWTNVSSFYGYALRANKTKGPVVAKEAFFPSDGGPGFSEDNQILWYGSYAYPGQVNGQPFHFVWGEAFDQPWMSSTNTYEPHMGLHSINNADGSANPKPIISQLQADYTDTSQLMVTAQPPTGLTTDSRFGITVAAEDSAGNVTSFGGNMTIALGNNPGGSTLNGMTTVQAVNGVATFSGLSLSRPGTGYSLVVSANGVPATTTIAFDVAAAPATHLAVLNQPPTAVTAGGGFGVTLAAEDNAGNPSPDFNGPVTISLASNPGGSTLGGVLTAQANSGVVTFPDLLLTKAGTPYTLIVTATGLASVTTIGFTVAPAAATQLVVTMQPPKSVTVGNSFALRVAAEDRFGNLDTNFNQMMTLRLANNPGMSTLAGVNPITATKGVANFSSLKLNNTGTGYTLQVVSNGFPAATTNAFDVISTPPMIVAGHPGHVLNSQKTNKRGKPVGKKVPIGFEIDFTTDLSPTSAGNPGNYEIVMPVRKGRKIVPKPVGFRVVVPSSRVVQLLFTGKARFPLGGLITVHATPPNGISSTSGLFLDGNDDVVGGDNAVLKILRNAKGLVQVLTAT